MLKTARLLGIVAGCTGAFAQTLPGSPAPRPSPLSQPIGWKTNGPAVFAVFTNPPPSGWFTNSAGAAVRRPVSRLIPTTVARFQHFLPESLNNLIWTNFIAHTNGRTTRIWSVREHPPGWPAKAPVVQWDTHCLMWGMRGMTALSPCWEGEGFSGQVPVTALTRRHAYARGHGMGPDGFNTNFAGQHIWFITTSNTLVTRTVLRNVVRTASTVGQHDDYTLLLLDQDLPDSIHPLRVAAGTNVWAKYLDCGAPRPMFLTEQSGHVSAMVPDWSVETWKGGDSGSPNMMPMPGELVFYGGRSTSGPSPEMQADMDELCRLERLDPKAYQLQWVDLSRY